MLTYLMCTHWPTTLSRTVDFNFRFLFPRAKKLLFLSETWLIIRCSPKQITQRQALVSKIFHVY
jgi:hypothetical protein